MKNALKNTFWLRQINGFYKKPERQCKLCGRSLNKDLRNTICLGCAIK